MRTLRPTVWPSLVLSVVTTVAATFIAPGESLAQFGVVSSVATEATRAERERQYDLLARDVAALERELGIIKRVVKLVTPSVVHIEAQSVRSESGRTDIQEAGSGVIVDFDSRPFVITNRHVIKNSEPRYVRIQLADGAVINPSQIWSDRLTDVAVMKLDEKNVLPARLGNSSTIEIGEQVLAVGSPFGLSQSVTRGIISAKGRYNLELGDGEVKYQNFLQTDAAINPGNSGGPLINLRGEVVGINTAIASSSGGSEGIGFSIPINIVTRIARDLATKGEVTRGFLGVKLDALFDNRRARSIGLPRLVGTRVTSVEDDSPADQAQLQVGDVIISYDGIRVEDDDHLISLVNLTEINRDVPVVVYRNRATRRLSVRIGDRSKYPSR